MLEGRADLAVHSMKDVPVEFPQGLGLAAVLPREDPRDALISNKYSSIDELPQGACVGTSSLRRQCQLQAIRPDLAVADLRGNVNTRLRKLQEGQYDAIILACAGLERLGMGHLVTEELGPPRWLPAATQGTIGVQCRAGDESVAGLISVLSDADAVLRTAAERAVATALQGSCQVPLAVYADIIEGEFRVRGMVGMPDGSRLLRAEARGASGQGGDLAAAVAEDLIRQGADRIIAELGQ